MLLQTIPSSNVAASSLDKEEIQKKSSEKHKRFQMDKIQYKKQLVTDLSPNMKFWGMH